MTTIEPDIPDKGRYPIGETAKHLGVTPRTILRYTEEGTLKFGISRANGRKFFTGAEIKRFWKAQY